MQDERSRRDSSGRAHAPGASGGVHSQRLHGKGVRGDNCRPNAPKRHFATDRGLLGLDAKPLHSVDDICIESRSSAEDQIARG